MSSQRSAFRSTPKRVSVKLKTLKEWLEISTITSGVRWGGAGLSNSDFPERFEQPGQRWLQRPGETEPQR